MPGGGKNDAFSDFRVSPIDELWLALIGCAGLSVKQTIN